LQHHSTTILILVPSIDTQGDSKIPICAFAGPQENSWCSC
jgi:hypothetical protein